MNTHTTYLKGILGLAIIVLFYYTLTVLIEKSPEKQAIEYIIEYHDFPIDKVKIDGLDMLQSPKEAIEKQTKNNLFAVNQYFKQLATTQGEERAEKIEFITELFADQELANITVLHKSGRRDNLKIGTYLKELVNKMKADKFVIKLIACSIIEVQVKKRHKNALFKDVIIAEIVQ